VALHRNIPCRADLCCSCLSIRPTRRVRRISPTRCMAACAGRNATQVLHSARSTRQTHPAILALRLKAWSYCLLQKIDDPSRRQKGRLCPMPSTSNCPRHAHPFNASRGLVAHVTSLANHPDRNTSKLLAALIGRRYRALSPFPPWRRSPCHYRFQAGACADSIGRRWRVRRHRVQKSRDRIFDTAVFNAQRSSLTSSG